MLLKYFKAKPNLYVSIIFGLMVVVAWSFFAGFGKYNLVLHDWNKEMGYLEILEQAIRTKQLPFHSNIFFGETDRFLAIPEVNILPTFFLVTIIGKQAVTFLNLVILILFGLLGAHQLSEKLALNVKGYLLFLAAFFLNGFIISHYAVGHSVYIAYFTFTWHLFFMICHQQEAKLKHALWHAMLLLLIVVLGAYHLFVFCILHLLFSALTKEIKLKTSLKIIFVGFLLAAFRFIPAAISIKSSNHHFVSGFPDVASFFDSLVVLKKYEMEGPAGPGSFGWFEYTYFIGAPAVALLILGFISNYRMKVRNYLPGVKASLILFVLSFGDTFMPWNLSGLPILNGERFLARMFCIPFIYFILIGSMGMKNEQGNKKEDSGFLFYILFVLMLAMIPFDFLNWQSALGSLGPNSVAQEFDISIIFKSEIFYTSIWYSSAALSLITLIATVYLLCHESKREAVK